MVVWITGRPASGKTTLGNALVSALLSMGKQATLIDSDEVRAHLTPDAAYTADERAIVYRAIAYVARRLSSEGVVAVVAATAHDRALRDAARAICPGMILVHARCSASVCEARDPKGLYRAARAGESSALPGVGVAWVDPSDADVVVDTTRTLDELEIDDLAVQLLARA